MSRFCYKCVSLHSCADAGVLWKTLSWVRGALWANTPPTIKTTGPQHLTHQHTTGPPHLTH